MPSALLANPDSAFSSIINASQLKKGDKSPAAAAAAASPTATDAKRAKDAKTA